jgi:16S rRNA C1402 N4-methylase RsmH
VAAGEAAKSCAEAGPAMQRVIAQHRQDFVDAVALDQDKNALRAATEWLETHQDRYADLETRMEALAERCAADETVQAAFRQMESP